MANSDAPLDAALAEYFDALDRGVWEGEERFLERHEAARNELRSFFDVERRVVRGFGSIEIDDSLSHAAGLGPGDCLGEYRILGELGRGGMGVVYEAEQPSLGRRVALKVLPSSPSVDDRRLVRFYREAQAAARLEHPAIVPVFAAGQIDGVHFIAMKRVFGRSLADWVREHAERAGTECTRERSRRLRDACAWVAQAAEALDYSHQRGVVHRDVKPSNLLVDAENAVWITDFGVAKAAELGGETATGALLGTLRYMSPEQLRGDPRSVDHRTDVYSLGATLFELVALRPMQADDLAAGRVAAFGSHTAPRLRKIAPDTPIDLETIVDKATRVEPSDRYPTALALAEDLHRHLAGQPVRARPVSAAERVWKWARRRPALIASAVTATLLLIVALSVAVVAVNRSRLVTVASLRQSAEVVYSSEMRDAYAAWSSGWTDEARRILDNLRPGRNAPDLRGVEWRLLDRLAAPPEPILLGEHAGAATEIAVFPAGDRVVSVGEDGAARVYNLTSRTQEVFPLADEPLHSVAVSPDGSHVAAGGTRVYLCDLDRGGEVRALVRFEHTVDALAFRPDGRAIAAAVRYSEACLLDLSGDIFARVPCRSRGESIQFLNQGDEILLPNRLSHPVAGVVGVAQVWSGDLARKIRDVWCIPVEAPEGVSLALQAGVRSRIAVGCGNDGRTHLIDTDSGRVLASSPAGRDALTALAIRRGRIAAGYGDGLLAESPIETADNREERMGQPTTVRGHIGLVTSLAYAGDALVSSGADGRVCLWPANTGPERSIAITCKGLEEIAIAPDGEYAALLGSREVIFVDHNCVPRERVRLEGAARCAAWSPSSDVLAVGCGMPPRVVFLNRDGTMVRAATIESPPTVVRYTPDGAALFVAEERQVVELDAETGAKRRAIPTPGNRVDGVAVTQDFVAVSGEWGSILLAPRAVGIASRTIACRSNPQSLAVSPDGLRLISGHDDSVLRVWDMETHRLQAELRGHHTNRLQVHYLQDGRTILSATKDGELRIWNALSGRAIGVLIPRSMDRSGAGSLGNLPLVFAASGGRAVVAQRRNDGAFDCRWWDLD